MRRTLLNLTLFDAYACSALVGCDSAVPDEAVVETFEIGHVPLGDTLVVVDPDGLPPIGMP